MEKLFLWIEDHDNMELPADERVEQMEDAVRTFNQDNGTLHDPVSSILAYEDWRIDKNNDQ